MTRIAERRLIRRSIQLAIGLFFYGIGIAFMVRGMIGAAPWDVLALGIIRHIPLSFGIVTVAVSAVVLLLWIPLRQRLGIGTVLNALTLGPFADLGLYLIPADQPLWLRIIFFAIGLIMLSVATGLYIGAEFGPGPRDGLMTGLHARTGLPIWVVRTSLEVTVVVIGWLLGGNVGAGTIVFALAIGPLCQVFMPIFAVKLPSPAYVEGNTADANDIHD